MFFLRSLNHRLNKLSKHNVNSATDLVEMQVQHGSCQCLQSEPWGVGQGHTIERFEGQVSDVSGDSSSQF